MVFNNASGFYRATSVDGISWTPDWDAPDLAWDSSAPGEALGLLTGADATVHGDGRTLVYVGFDEQDVPEGFYAPVQSWYDPAGYASVITALNIATR